MKTILLSLFAAVLLAVSPSAFADEGDYYERPIFAELKILTWEDMERVIAENRAAAGYPIFYASDNGDIAEVKRLLDGGANPNAVDKDGNTALMQAAEKGYAEIVKVLLSAGANPNALYKWEYDNGVTALMQAAKHGNAEVVKVLLGMDINPIMKLFSDYADVNAVNNDGETALDLANEGWSSSVYKTQEKAKEFKEVVRILKEAGAK